MTETQTLWAALAIIYAFESFRWLRAGSLGVRTWLGRRWRMVGPSMLLGNHGGGLVCLHPLPPLGSLLVSVPLPVTFTTEGMANDRETVRWAELGRIEVVNRRLKLDGRVIADAGSNALAATLQATFRSLAAVPEAARSQALQDAFLCRLNPGEARARWEQFRRETQLLRWLCNAMFLFLFVVVPWVTHHHGLRETWWILLIGVFGCATSIAQAFRGHHRRLYPAAQEERLTVFLTTLLSPASAIRAHDRLTLPLLADFHPLALARAFCPEVEFRRLAADVLRQLHYPRPAELNGPALPPAERRWQLSAVEGFLRREGVAVEHLLRPPPAEQACVGYCPRCLAQFTHALGTCVDCGVAVLPLNHIVPQQANEDRAQERARV